MKSSVLGAALGGVLGAAGCGGDGRDANQDAVIGQYVKVVRASYDDSIAAAKTLRDSVAELLAEPSQKALDAARDAWIEARPAYLQTEAYRFYDGPIDNPKDGREPRINAWLLDESVIDYVAATMAGDVVRRGIINDRPNYPDLNKELLLAENDSRRGYATTGFHAIEFLLWGQDTSDEGPGDRPFSDYVAGQGSSEPDADRRRQYLKLVADLLVEDLEYTRARWNDGEPYVKAFLANAKDEALKNIIKGIARLTKQELAEARIRPGSESGDQDEEHSRFSDTTDQDLKFPLVGIENVYFGRYGKNDGKGLEDLVIAADPDLDAQIKQQLESASKAIAAIPVPFDQAIKNDRPKLRAALRALDELNLSLLKIQETLDL